MTDIISAIKAIKADAHVTVNGESVDGIIWHDDNPTNITNEEILAKQTELQDDYNALQYQRDRAIAYKELKEQLDLLYHDMVADKGDKTGEWFKHIKAVKDANPKE
tara:strand:+ start:258 stop:575 length:318 start_codon:yes stop_codon:yes gene_type:complete